MNKISVSSAFHPTRWFIIGSGALGTYISINTAIRLIVPFALCFPREDLFTSFGLAAGCALTAVASLQACVVVTAIQDIFSRTPYVQAPLTARRLALLVLYFCVPIFAAFEAVRWSSNLMTLHTRHAPIVTSLQEFCTKTTVSLVTSHARRGVSNPMWSISSVDITGLANLPECSGIIRILSVEKGDLGPRKSLVPLLVSYRLSDKPTCIFHIAYLVSFQPDTGQPMIVSVHIFDQSKSVTTADLDGAFWGL